LHWASQAFSAWLRRHFERQLREAQVTSINTVRQGTLGALAKEDAAGQPNGTDVASEIDVEPRLILSPPPPERSDIPLLQVTLTNYGKADLVEAHFLVSLSQGQ